MILSGSMYRLLLSALFFFTTAAGVNQLLGGPSQEKGPSDQQAKSEPRSISGVVVNSVTNQPIARALVQLGNHAGLTDHDGHFEFNNVTEWQVTAFATKPGYFNTDGSITSVAGPAAGPVTVVLIPEAILSGTVTDQNGQPIQNLEVQLRMLQVQNGLRHSQNVQATTTNAEGEYRFAELRAGKYSVVTGFHLEGLPETTSSVAFVPVVYPPPHGDEAGAELTLAPGDHMEANLTPSAEKLYPVTGSVHGRVAQGVNITAETKDGELLNPPVRLRLETGTFRVLLPSGSYQLNARSFSDREQSVGASQVFIDHAALEGISISLAPQTNIPLEVQYDAVNASTQDAPSGSTPSLNVSLQDASLTGPMRMVYAQPVRSPGDMRAPQPGDPLAFQGVEPGRYELQAQTSPPWYLASATCGNVDLTRDPLVSAIGTGACSIQAVLRNDSATLKWSIAPAAPDSATGPGSASATVYVEAIPLGNVTQPVATAGASGPPFDGSFAGLAPGRYLVLALAHQQELPYRDPDALRHYLSLGQEVTLARNGQAEVQLTLVMGEP